MTKKYSTKKVLVASMLSLLLCFSMLIGTTYAWFTDSVTSTGNIIKTGTLDVTLEYSNEAPADKDDALWTDASTGAIFSYDNWEPGYVQVRYVKIENEGTLDLKFVLNIIPNANATDVDLADVIEVYMVEDAVSVNRADLTTTSAAYKGTLASLIADEDGAAYGTLTDGAFEIYTIALKMSESAGNEYQNKSVGGGFAVQLLATQLASEEDDIDDQYDKDAEYLNISAPVAVPDNATASMTLVGKDVTVNIPAEVVNNLPAEVTSVAVKYTAPQVDATTGVVAFESVDLVDQNGNVIDLTNNTTPVAVVLPAQTALAGKDVVIMHDGVVVDSTTVGADGAISYTANHFCEVTVVTTTKVGTADELKAAVANGGNIQLAADITMSAKLNITADTVIFGMGKTLTYTGSDRAITAENTANGANLTIQNLTVDCTASYCERGINYNTTGALTLNNVTVIGTNVNYGINLPASSDNAIVTINDSNILGNIALNVWGENSVIVANNTNFRSDYVSEAEACPVIKLNMDNNGNTATGTKFTVNGGSIISDADTVAVEVVATNVTVDIGNETEIKGAFEQPVAMIVYEGQTQFYTAPTFARAIAQAKDDPKATVVLLKNIDLTQTVVIDGTVAIDLNGYTISGTCNASQGYLFMVNNGAKLTILDSSADESGKITFAQGTSNVGWAIDLEGELVLESGTIELTGDSWSIGYCVDVRPNAWGTDYANPTVFTMNGGKVVSSDGAIRVASSSDDSYTGVSAKFVMNGGEVEAAWDGIFVQQSNTVYDILTVELNAGKVASALSPVRVYGPVATSVVGGAEKPMTLTIGANAELSVIGEIDTTRTWYKEGVVVLGGGMTVEALEQYATIVIAE